MSPSSVPVPVVADDATFWVVEDRVLGTNALVAGQAYDELTGLRVDHVVRVAFSVFRVVPPSTADRAPFTTVTGADGVFALAGEATVAFPGLAATAYRVDLTISCPGYLDSPTSVQVPAGTTVFPLPAVRVPMRRPAIRLVGRINRKGANPLPVPGAMVAVIDPPGIIGLGTPLAFEHQAGTSLRPVALTPAGPDLGLQTVVVRGSARMPFDRRAGLSAGAVVQLGTGPDREYVVVDSLGGPPDPALSGSAVLRTPVVLTRRPGDSVTRATVGPPGAPATLTQEALPQDRVAFVNNPGPLATQATALVNDADPTQREYLVVSLAEAVTDADGFYRLGPVGRAATVTVRVTNPGPPANQTDVIHTMSYTAAENVLNVKV